MDFINLKTLRRLAVYGAVVSVSASAYMYYKIQEKFANSPYYKKSLQAMKEDDEVVNYLGLPIATKFLNLAEKSNSVTEDRAELHIPLRGSKHSAELHTICTHTEPDGWKVEDLKLDIRGKILPVYFKRE